MSKKNKNPFGESKKRVNQNGILKIGFKKV